MKVSVNVSTTGVECRVASHMSGHYVLLAPRHLVMLRSCDKRGNVVRDFRHRLGPQKTMSKQLRFYPRASTSPDESTCLVR